MQMLKKHFDAAAADGVEGRLSMELFIVVMSQLLNLPDEVLSLFCFLIEYGIPGEGSQISTNQKRESTVSSFLIG